MKHVLKPNDSHSHNQNVRMKSCIRSLPDASSARYKSRLLQSHGKIVLCKSVLRQLPKVKELLYRITELFRRSVIYFPR